MWDFLQRYDESWIWRRTERHEVTESSRNFAARDECIADATLQMVLLLTELKDPAGAIEWAKKFLDTTPGALETQHGLAVLAAKAEAHLALGDQRGASECADKLVATDPRWLDNPLTSQVQPNGASGRLTSRSVR